MSVIHVHYGGRKDGFIFPFQCMEIVDESKRSGLGERHLSLGLGLEV